MSLARSCWRRAACSRVSGLYSNGLFRFSEFRTFGLCFSKPATLPPQRRAWMSYSAPGADENPGASFIGICCALLCGISGTVYHFSAVGSHSRSITPAACESLHSNPHHGTPQDSNEAETGRKSVWESGNSTRSSSSQRTDDTMFAEWNDCLDELLVFSGTSNPELAHEVCSHLGIPLGRARIGRFADGEVTLELLDEVRGQHVFVIQSAPCASSNHSPHSSLMELFFMIAAAKRASAKHVTAVLPYASYFRQLANGDGSTPLAGADIGRILVAMGVDRVIFIDVHTPRVEGLIPESLPITNLKPHALATTYLSRKKDLKRNVVVVSTDNTGTERAEAFMSRMSQAGFTTSFATIVSSRPERPQREPGPIILTQQPELGVVVPHGSNALRLDGTATDDTTVQSKRVVDWLVGDVNGKDCVIVDDVIDTGERAVNTANALRYAGARNIYMFATHGVFSRGALDRFAKSPIKEVIITDTIRLPENLYCEKLRVISVSRLLAETIRRVHCKLPLSTLHRDPLFDTVMEKGIYTK